MAVKWIIGRAGTGKTRHCITALKALAREQPLGPTAYLLAPEQAVFMTEQRLITGDDPLCGSFRVRVAGIRRFCKLMAPKLELAEVPELTPIRRAIVLARVLQQCRGKLTVLADALEKPGFLRTLDAMIGELEQNGQTSAEIQSLAREPGIEPMLAAKLNDFAIILHSWDSAARTAPFGDREIVQRTAEALAADGGAVRNCQIFIDAFSSFNRREMRLIAQLGRQCRNLTITLLADPASPGILRQQAPPDPLSLFYRTEILFRQMNSEFRAAGVAEITVESLTTSHRFAGAALARLESDLWKPAGGPESDDCTHKHSAAAPDNHSEIEIWPCNNIESEVLAAARHIERSAANGLRYGDIGLVVADIDQYREMITRIFAARGIPFFLDQRADMAHHPLLELLRGTIHMARSDFSRQRVLALLKTRLTGISPQDVYAMENYMLAHGVDVGDLSAEWRWNALPTDPDMDEPTSQETAEISGANRARQTLYNALTPWIQMCQSPAITGGSLAKGLLDLLSRLEAPATLDAWIAADIAAGRLQLAQIHQQAWSQTQLVLKELEELTSDAPMSLTDFGRLLFAILDNLTLGLVPPALDQVLISTAKRSRHPELRHVIVLGVIETAFPKVDMEDALLDNMQRRWLNSRREGCVNTGSDENLLQAPFFDYVAFTRASHKLILSWPQKDSQGARTAPSLYLDRLQAEFGVSVRRPAETGLACATRPSDVMDSVLRAMRSGRHTANDGHISADIIFAYNWLRNHTDSRVQQEAIKAWAGMNSDRTDNEPALPPDIASVSVSQLQTAASCRLQYFFKYTLGLRLRPELAMDALTRGQLLHKILEWFYAGVIKNPTEAGAQWPAWPAAALADRLNRVSADQQSSLEKEMFQNQPETAIMLAVLRNKLLILLAAHQKAAAQNNFRPLAVEQRFGNPNAATHIPGFQLSAGPDRLVPVLGKIDRLDCDDQGNVFVLDYKTAAGHKFNPQMMQEGLDLQLIAYLLAIENARICGVENLHITGSFYQHILASPKIIDNRGDSITPEAPEYYKNFRPRGLFMDDYRQCLEPDLEDGQSGKWFPIRMTQNGGHQSGHDGYASAEFRELLRIGRQTMERLVGEIYSGVTGPNPWKVGNKSSCGTCDFKALCPFDRSYGQYRKINTAPKTAGATKGSE